MSPPEVTIVMPVWRAPRDWLQQAVASALDDDCDLELVVVDDGNDEAVADALGDVDDDRLRIIRIPHGGQGAAIEAGIATARGTYLRFADADDVVAPGSTSWLLARAAGRDDVITYGATVVCDERLRPTTTLVSDVVGDARIVCLLGEFHVRHVSMLFPRRVVDRALPWAAGLRVSGDWDFVLRTLDHATVEGDSRPVTFYRRHGRSMTGTADVRAGESDRERVIERFLVRHPAYRGETIARRARLALLLDRADAYAAVGDGRRSIDRLRRGIRLAPWEGLRAVPRVARLLARSRLPMFGGPGRGR